MIWILIVAIVICIIAFVVMKNNKSSGGTVSSDSVNPEVTMLMSIVTKFAQSHHDSGLLKIKESEGLYIAILNGFEDGCNNDGFYRAIYHMTDDEIRWMNSRGRIDRESMNIVLRVGKSPMTANYVKGYVEQNKTVFDLVDNNKTEMNVHIRG